MAEGRAELRRVHRVLVTGATGFLGQPLVTRLIAEGYQVTALGRRTSRSPFPPTVEYAAGDLTMRDVAVDLLRAWRWDAVVNLAGPVPKDRVSWDDEYDLLMQHVHIAMNVCRAIPASWPGRFIQISSMGVYGLPEQLPVEESHPKKPISLYGVAKSLAEETLSAIAQCQGWDCWILRLPGLFSEHRHSGALFAFMRAAVEGRPLRVLPERPTPWDLLHVDDAVEAISRVLASPARNPGAVNIGYGHPVELMAIAEQVATRSDHEVAVENVGGAQHPVFQMDIGKARQLLAWPPATLDERLETLWCAISAAAPSGLRAA